MPKITKNVSIEDNQGRSSLIFELHKRENAKNKAKVILKKDDQDIRDFFLYHSISKF